MKVKIFEDKYDKEFVTLMLEIEKRIEPFEKSDKLKIKSWVKALCMPTSSTLWKKNRNLYSILLLDNIVNGKLEPPFNKFAIDNGELDQLNPTVVKSKLTSKFLTEIRLDQANDDIQNFIDAQYGQNAYEGKKQYEDEIEQKLKKDYINIDEEKKPNKIIKKNIQKSNIKTKPINNDLLIPSNSYRETTHIRKKNNTSDMLLKKNYFGLTQKLQNETGFTAKTKPSEKLEKIKLESMVKFLENEMIIKNQIIQTQQKDLNQLKSKVKALEKKFNYIFPK